MRVSDFDFELPRERIAQRPAPGRDESRLMVLRGDATEHRRFADLGELLRNGDLLVLNDTKVLPARLTGRKESGGRVELLLLEPASGDLQTLRWRCLIQSARSPRKNGVLELGEGLSARVVEREEDAWVVDLDPRGAPLAARLEQLGAMPLPPYIRREGGGDAPEDAERYQTVYATRPGAVAAPTAGLHFTGELLQRLQGGGVETARITLHVGLGTFLPVRVERVEDHVMHDERLELPEETADAVARTRERGGRVIAVGTTAVRTLESRVDRSGRLLPGTGRSNLFIYPGFRFRVVDLMITNFHLPRSTLLMLVSAFAGRQRLLAAYREAVERGYRFYSYGDAMLVWPR